MKFRQFISIAFLISGVSAAPQREIWAQPAAQGDLLGQPVLEIIDPGTDHVKHLMQYSIRVYRDGSATFHGEDASGTLKTIPFSVSLERLAFIERKAEEVGFRRLSESYEDVLGELPKTIAISFASRKSKKVNFALRRAPIEIFDFLKILNEQLGIDRFRCPRMIQNMDECVNERVAFENTVSATFFL